ncbi:hypothetical protein [Bacillus sp. EB01]|uniref:hypothetical protein n=1 Tax=Bacillus sp. EB01 TaxID=1347086 RepID=UPI0005C58CC8|nr:hypothetical protein [Bacillus sp. EB01]
MNNIDFSDVHKFLVSVGLGTIVFAFLLPWLFLKEEFNLYLEKDTVAKYTDDSQKVIHLKNSILIDLFSNLHWITILFLAIGLFLIGVGIFHWWRKQKEFDKGQVLDNMNKELTNKKLKKELEDTTPSEKASAVLNEINADLFGTASAATSDSIVPENPISQKTSVTSTESVEIVKAYNRIEHITVGKITEKYSNKYEVVLDKKILNLNLNILLLGRTNDFSDRIIEIKYRSQSPLTLTEATELIDALEQVYKLATGRIAIPLIVLVTSAKIKIHSEQILNPLISQNKLVLLIEDELIDWDPIL